MNMASVRELCLQLISSAFQRCRASDDLCRLSIILRRSSAPNLPPSVRISVSDTGVGSCLEEFGALKLCREAFGAEIWDGMLSVTTTSIGDNEIFHYQFNLKEAVSTRRLTRLPSNPKNGQKFSGTEVCLSIFESIDVLLAEISRFFQKILILKIPNVAIQLVVEHGDVPGSRYEHVFLPNEGNPLPFSASNLERLKSGLEDYVFKHGNTLGKKCESCFSNWEHLKVGTGVACRTESRKYSESVMEAVIVISEISELASTCLRTCGSKTEVLYFKDFSVSPISQSSVKALTSIDWKSYGLTFRGVVDQGGFALLEWENLPPYIRIHISLHHYHNQVTIPSARLKMQPDQNLIRKAVKLALDDLKDKHTGELLSAHALKNQRRRAPDLGTQFRTPKAHRHGDHRLSRRSIQSRASSQLPSPCFHQAALPLPRLPPASQTQPIITDDDPISTTANFPSPRLKPWQPPSPTLDFHPPRLLLFPPSHRSLTTAFSLLLQ